MAEIEITRTTTATGRRYAARIDGLDAEAELTYRQTTPAVVVANHTYAPDLMRGTGVAKALVDRLIADARSEGFKIVPTCTYVKAQFQRHPDWADVLAP